MIRAPVSSDGLWEWNGGEWVPARRVTIVCPYCVVPDAVQLLADDSSFQCRAGHTWGCVCCKRCGTYFLQPHLRRRKPGPCPACGASDRPLAYTAWHWVYGSQNQGGSREPLLDSQLDRDRRTLSDFALAASGGSSIPTGTVCTIDFAGDGVRILALGRMELIPYSAVRALEVTGGTTRSGGGFFGGGFGVQGAAEGMLVASVLNSLTSRTRINTVLRLATPSAEYVFLSHRIDADALRLSLTPVQPLIRRARATPSPPVQTPLTSAPGVADELAKLAQLRDQGVLSESQFESAKSRLLHGM